VSRKLTAPDPSLEADGEALVVALAADLKVKWAFIHMNESVIFEDMTVRSSQHWTVYGEMVIEAGNELVISLGAQVLIQP